MRNKTTVSKFYFLKNENLTAILKYIILCVPVLGVFCRLPAQDILMSQYFCAPLQLNPAMAGISYGPRVTLNYRNEWSSLGNGFNGGFTSYMAAYDMHIDAISAGIGAMFVGDQIANGIYATYTAKVMYSQQFKFNRKMALKLGLEGDYIRTQLNWNDLLWSDMINPLSGFYNNINVPNPTQEELPGKLYNNNGEMAAGAVFFTEKYYIGFAAHNLLMHKQSFYDDQSPTPIEFVAHAGANLPLNSAQASRNNIWLSPNVLFMSQGAALQAEGTLLMGISLIYFGLGYRNDITNSDAVIGYLGVKKGKFRVGYSYDYTISKLIKQTGGTHELSFTFNWTGEDNSLNPKKAHAYVPCPDILNF